MKKHSINHTLNRNVLLHSAILSTLCIVTYYSGLYFAIVINSSIPEISGLWAVISAIIVFEESYKKIITASKNYIIASLLGVIVSVVLLSLLGVVFWSWFLCCILIVILAHIIKMAHNIKIALLNCTLVYVVHTIGKTTPIWLIGSQRGIECVIGVIIAIIMNRLNDCINKTE